MYSGARARPICSRLVIFVDILIHTLGCVMMLNFSSLFPLYLSLMADGYLTIHGPPLIGGCAQQG